MNNRSAALFQHRRNDILRTQEESPKVYAHRAVPDLQVQFVRTRISVVKQNGSVVIKHVDAAVLVERVLYELPDLILIADVGTEKEGIPTFTPRLPRNGLSALDIGIGGDNACTLSRKPGRHGFAQPACSAGDNGDLALQSHVDLHYGMLASLV